MVKGLYTAWTGMIDEQNRLDILSNNLANADTNGYKKEGTTNHTFADELAIRIKDSSSYRLPVTLGEISLGVRIGENYTDYTQGNFKVTDRNADMAIDGEGFFAIAFTNKQGETSMKLTRDGAFAVTRDGFLVTKDGDYVLNKAGALAGNTGAGSYIQLDPTAEFRVLSDGTIMQNDQVVDQLGVVDVADYDYISKYGENMYQIVDGGQIVDSDAAVEQGVLEASNINVVSEMVDMITITRAYEAGQKIIQTIDSTLEKAVNNVGKV